MTPLETFFCDVTDSLGVEHIRLLKLRTVMAHALSERERQVLELRFGLDGTPRKTLQEIATVFQVTRERIRQVEAKALRRLRHPALLARLYRLFGVMEEPTFLACHPEIRGALTVEALELSTRPTLCLREAGIKTVAELCAMSPSDLLRFRNFGRKSLQEIINALAKLNLSLNVLVCPTCLTTKAELPCLTSS